MLHCMSIGWKDSREFAVSESLRNSHLFLGKINHYIVFILNWNGHLYKREWLKSQSEFFLQSYHWWKVSGLKHSQLGFSFLMLWIGVLHSHRFTGDSMLFFILQTPPEYQKARWHALFYLEVIFKASLNKQLTNDLIFKLNNLKQIQWPITTLCSRVFLSFMPRLYCEAATHLSIVKTWKTCSETVSVF